MRIGIIGLGAMGLPLARHVIGRSNEVAGFDVRESALREFRSDGGIAVASPAEVAKFAEATILLVRDGAQVRDAVCGDDGWQESASAGDVLVVASSVAPALVAQLGKPLAERGIHVVDAPVSGGTQSAADGTLTVMAAGPQDAITAAEPVLDLIGANVFHLSEQLGMGQTAKAVNQLVYFANLAVAAEGLVLGAKAGIAPEMLTKVLEHGTADSWALRNRVADGWDPTFQSTTGPLAAALKDLATADSLARDHLAPTPMAAAASQLYRAAANTFGVDAKSTDVFRLLAQLTGLEPPWDVS